MQSLLVYASATFASFLFLWQFIKLYFPWLLEDISYIKIMSSKLRLLNKFREKSFFLSDKVSENGKKLAYRKFVLYEDQSYTFEEMDQWSNRCARGFRKLGLRSGDKVGLMMMNEPAYIAMWVGSIRTGVTTSFLNYNLRAKSLMHCITLSDFKVLVIGEDEALMKAVEQVEDELKSNGIEVFVYGPATPKFKSFSDIVDEQPWEDCPGGWKGDRKYHDTVCYIFTSGTTGLPKAVRVDNGKCWTGGVLMGVVDPNPDDVIYTAMPLYHSAASLIGTSGAILAGCSIVLRKKFSASQFWPDCRKYNVTIAQYVGETLRYVCHQPTTPDNRNHKVRAVVGNGLRPDVWRTFLHRYGPDIHVFEFYAATEGNVGFINAFNKFGCVGTCSPLLRMLGSAAIVKYDMEKEEVLRGSNGRVMHANNDEPGLLIGKITKQFRISEYHGKASLTEKKILRNVFKDGDKYFNTGDLLKICPDYRLVFCDRIGDTFRWKGENVSTNEVGDTVAQAPGIKHSNAYGVEIPGCDGRAGMVAVVLNDEKLNLEQLYAHVCDALPSYARPLFLRILPEMEMTGTIKQRKVNLKKEGYSLANVGTDEVYFLDHKLKSYVRLTEAMQSDIENGVMRV